MQLIKNVSEKKFKDWSVKASLGSTDLYLKGAEDILSFPKSSMVFKHCFDIYI